MNISLKQTAIAGVVALALAGWWWHARQPVSATPAAAPQMARAALSVEATQATAIHWPTTLTLNGSIYAWQEALVSAEISGLRIREVLADVGSEVRKGQPLVLLADETVQADLQKQYATVEKDKASLAEAQSNAARAREIQDSGALSKQKINEYLIAEQTAKANLALSQAELENQKIRLRQTRVVAPDDGVIASRSANLGNVVSAGTELFRLVRQGRIEWRGEINMNEQTALRPGQAVTLTLPAGSQIQGKVRLISPTVDSNTRNALIYVDLPSRSAKPGMYVQGQVDIGRQSGLAVPLSAVVYRDGFAYVFTLEHNAQAGQTGLAQVRQHKVRTGRTQGTLIELLEGIDARAKLVLSGGAFLNDGDTVNIVTANVQGGA